MELLRGIASKTGILAHLSVRSKILGAAIASSVTVITLIALTRTCRRLSSRSQSAVQRPSQRHTVPSSYAAQGPNTSAEPKPHPGACSAGHTKDTKDAPPTAAAQPATPPLSASAPKEPVTPGIIVVEVENAKEHFSRDSESPEPEAAEEIPLSELLSSPPRVVADSAVCETMKGCASTIASLRECADRDMSSIADGTSGKNNERIERIKAIDNLLRNLFDTYELERVRVAKWAMGSLTKKLLERIQLMSNAASALTLRKVIGAENSRKYAACVVCEMGQSRHILSQLSAFTCYLVGKELMLQEIEPRISEDLLMAALHGLPPQVLRKQTLPTDEQKNIRVLTGTPLAHDAPFFLPDLWFLLGLAASSCPSDESASRLFELFGEPVSPKEFWVRCLEASSGNHMSAWRALAGEEDGIDVLGVHVSPVECIAESIRVAGGFEFCREYKLWLDAAEILSGRPAGATMLITRFGHEPFLFPSRKALSHCVACNVKECLVKALALPQGNVDAKAWSKLGNVLQIGTSMEHASSDGTILKKIIKEETANVSGLNVTKMDCYSLALSLNPLDSTTWYRVAVSIEDYVREAAQAASSGYQLHPNVYERQLLGHSDAPVDRIAAFLHAITIKKDYVAAWFALGATLFERSNALVQPEGMRIKIAEELFRDGDTGDQPKSSQPYRIVSASDIFDHCKKLQPQVAPVIDDWVSHRTTSE